MTVPYFIIVFGDIMDELNGDDIFDAVSSLSGVFAGTGAVAFVSGFFMVRASCPLLFRQMPLNTCAVGAPWLGVIG